MMKEEHCDSRDVKKDRINDTHDASHSAQPHSLARRRRSSALTWASDIIAQQRRESTLNPAPPDAVNFWTR